MANINFLAKERKLMEAVINDADFEEQDWEFWEKTFLSFVKLVNAVIKLIVMEPIYRLRYEGEEYRQNMEELEILRARRYDVVVDSIEILNRASVRYGMEKFADINKDNHGEVMNYAVQVVAELFSEGSKGLLSVIEGREEEYSLDAARENLRF